MALKEVGLTADRLREILHYNPDTGVFTWNGSSGGGALKGKVAGTLVKPGYIRIAVAGGRYYAQQLAWLHMHGAWPEECIDHINGDGKDNRISNLRKASHRENLQNQRRAHSNNISGLLGVSFRRGRGRYTSEIRSNGKRIFLGSFSTAEDAHKAYLQAKQEIHPFGTLKPVSEKIERPRKTNRTGVTGVEKRGGGKFSVRLNLDGVRVNVGLFADLNEAANAYAKARVDHLERKTRTNQA